MKTWGNTLYKNAAKKSLSRAFRSAIKGEEHVKKPFSYKGVPKKIKKSAKNGSSIEGYIYNKIKGGFRIKLQNADGFCPFSEFPRGFDEDDLLVLIHKKTQLAFKILKADKIDSIIVSRKKAAEEEGILIAKKSLNNNEFIFGKVKEVKEYGAFIDIGGIDGLAHISKFPLSMLPKKDELIKVKVLSIDMTKKHISLSAL
jgi:small subunit ribosomal protein S1